MNARADDGFEAVLAGRLDAGAGLALVTLAPPPEHAARFRAPGQYIEVRAEARGYFALASEIGRPEWELLVRMNGGASDALLSAELGTSFEIAGPLGDGFPLADGERGPIVVAVAGSALAVARPIVRARLAAGEARSTSVYIGARSAAEVALAHEVAGWAEAGVTVVLCLSRGEHERPSGGVTHRGVRRARGYVQSVLASDVREGAVAGSRVLAAGPSAMLDGLRALERDEGGATLEVVTNV